MLNLYGSCPQEQNHPRELDMLENGEIRNTCCAQDTMYNMHGTCHDAEADKLESIIYQQGYVYGCMHNDFGETGTKMSK